ncbi:hypothetical protein [Streptomyces boncukensis]|uniref:hypothetical protein n=1 Tax=Streptomyces boncukensis TaxID=2711219 RepID=UPI0019D1ED72|nr:hypothetical protein [Streptomyces boncukensis]
MNAPTPFGRARAKAAVTGLLTGAAVGLLLTQAVGAFSTFVLDHPLDVDGTGWLRAVFVAVPAGCGALGAVFAARRAGRGSHPNRPNHPNHPNHPNRPNNQGWS